MGCSESRSAEKQENPTFESPEDQILVSKEVQYLIYDCIFNDDTHRLSEGFKNGLPVDIKLDNFANRTILHIACEQGSEKITEMMIKKGCQVDVEDDYGITPLFLATIKNQSRCAEILQEAGAKSPVVSQNFSQAKEIKGNKKLRAA
jgi:ankyrin repeat protein